MNEELYKHDGKLFVKLCGCRREDSAPYSNDIEKFEDGEYEEKGVTTVDPAEICKKCGYCKWYIRPAGTPKSERGTK